MEKTALRNFFIQNSESKLSRVCLEADSTAFPPACSCVVKICHLPLTLSILGFESQREAEAESVNDVLPPSPHTTHIHGETNVGLPACSVTPTKPHCSPVLANDHEPSSAPLRSSASCVCLPGSLWSGQALVQRCPAASGGGVRGGVLQKPRQLSHMEVLFLIPEPDKRRMSSLQRMWPVFSFHWEEAEVWTGSEGAALFP